MPLARVAPDDLKHGGETIRYVGLNVHKATVAVAVVSYRTSVVAETSTSRVLCIFDSRRPGKAGLVCGQCSLQSHEDPAVGF